MASVRVADAAADAKMVRWQSRDPRTGKWMNYAKEVTRLLERKLTGGAEELQINIGGLPFTVRFGRGGATRQYNAAGGCRDVRRQTRDRRAGAGGGPAAAPDARKESFPPQSPASAPA
eukprot:gene12646-14711_t